MAERRKVLTRQTIRDPVFDEPTVLCEAVLPCYGDAMRYFLYIQNDVAGTGEGKNKTVTEIIKIVVEKTQQIWKKASLPFISDQQCLALLKRYHQQFMNIKKSLKKTSDAAKNKLQKFRDEANTKLFDISKCKCTDFSLCICERSNKVPKMEQAFLIDQRTTRLMFIGQVDAKTSRILQQKQKRKSRDLTCNVPEKKNQQDLPCNVPEKKIEQCNLSDTSEHTEADSNDDPDFEPEPSTSTEITIEFPALAKAIDRAGLSSRKGALIASAVLEDVGLISKNDKSYVIDKSKLDRQRKRQRVDLQKNIIKDGATLQALYFDGRKDRTLHIEKQGDTSSRKTLVEEHIVLLKEPGSEYIGHVTPENGTANTITSTILNFFTENEVSIGELIAVGCDGTVVNTGPHGGVIHLLELHIKRPLQWLICQLHANELPLRHLVRYLDGNTSGPLSFTGPIGKLIETCERLPVVRYEKIEVDLPEVNLKELSTDQNYLYQICTAISTGNCPSNLANKSPGKLSHARWLTTANRILRAYIAIKNPSPSLKILTEYILRVYAKVWFLVKTVPFCTSGALHLWKLIQYSRYLSDELKAVVDPVIQRNGFYGHPENIILNMIFDSRRHIRELGYRKILSCRSKEKENPINLRDTIRKFEIPKFNFEAESLLDLINWRECRVTEPPMTKHITDEEIQELIKTGGYPEGDLWKLPCHTQAVERGVKLVTEASSAVCGFTNRDGWIRTTIASRSNMPKFNSKSDYEVGN